MTTKSDRTRRDVVAAAIETWALDNTAPLGAVAAHAGVGRTTVNRYYPERTDLVAAVDAECRTRYAAAVARARPDEGTGRAALLRVCTELLQLGPVLGLVFADNALVDPDTWYAGDDDPLGRLIERGLTDGSLDPTLPPDWLGTVVWTTLFGAYLVVRSGTRTWHEAADLLTRTLTAGITP